MTLSHPIDLRARQWFALGRSAPLATRPLRLPASWIPASCILLGSALALASTLGSPSPRLFVTAALALAVPLLVSLEFAVGMQIALVTLFTREELFAFSIPFFGGGLKPTDVILLLIAIGYVIRRTLCKPTKLRPLPQGPTALLCGFVAWAGICAVVGISSGIHYKESLLEFRPLLQYLLFIPIVQEFNVAAVRRTIYVMMGCSVFVSLKALAQYSHATSWSHRVTDLSFPYLLFSFLLALVFCLHDSRNKALLVGLALLTFAALTVTFYRSAFVALGVALPFLIWKVRRAAKRRTFRYMLVAAMLAWLAIPVTLLLAPRLVNVLEALVARLHSIADYNTEASAQHRVREWRAASTLIQRHPLIGNGLGTRIQFFSPMYDAGRNAMGYWSNDFYTHNSYVWVLTKTGLIGLAIFLSFIVTVTRTALQQLRRRPERSGLPLGLLTCVIALGVTSIFGPMFNLDNVSPFFASAAAAIFVIDAHVRRESVTRERRSFSAGQCMRCPV